MRDHLVYFTNNKIKIISLGCNLAASFAKVHYQENIFFLIYIKPQKHRMVEVGRDLRRSSGPTTLLKQGHLDPVAQDHVQAASEYLQGWSLQNLSGQPVVVLSHPHR